MPTARLARPRRDFENYDGDDEIDSGGEEEEEDRDWMSGDEEEEEEEELDGDGDGGALPHDHGPIVSRDKRARQRKEEREHQSEEWFSKAWKGLTRR